MKLKTLILTGLAGIALTACATAPKIPTLDLGVLQEVSDLDVYPNTTNNKAKLTKFDDKCVIEFTGNLEAGKVIEQWSFKGYTLMTGGSATFAKDGTFNISGRGYGYVAEWYLVLNHAEGRLTAQALHPGGQCAAHW